MGEQTWYGRLGFDENPLDVRPNGELVGLGQQEERLVNHIQKGEICFLNGPTGSGKTSLLRRVQEKLKGHAFIYLNAEDLPHGFDLVEAIRGKRSFFDKLTFREYPAKTPVLLIDEFQATDPNLVLEAKGKWEIRRGVKSIVIAQISRQLNNVSGSFRDRLGKRIIHFPTLEPEEMREILKRRLHNHRTGVNYVSKLSEEAVNLLISCADSNPRRLLEYTDIIFDFHHTNFHEKNPLLQDNYTVSYYAARDILEAYDMSLGTGLGRLAGKIFRIGHLGDFNDLALMGTLVGVEMGLSLAGVPHQKGGVQAAMEYLGECARSGEARKAA